MLAYDSITLSVFILIIFSLVVSSVTPSSGSTAGGTTLTINGNFFSTSTAYPLIVNVGGEPCTILDSTTTTIHCQTAAAPSSSASEYQGWLNIENSAIKLD